MICTLDANALVHWVSPKSSDLTLAKLDFLLETVSKGGGRIVLPTPAISELLIRTDQGTAAWLAALQRRSSVVIGNFDLRAATECALIHRLALTVGSKRAGTKPGEAYQKIKVDRQIAAIAKNAGSDLVVTNDENLIAVCLSIGLQTSKVEQLETPESAKQKKLDI